MDEFTDHDFDIIERLWAELERNEQQTTWATADPID